MLVLDVARVGEKVVDPWPTTSKPPAAMNYLTSVSINSNTTFNQNKQNQNRNILYDKLYVPKLLKTRRKICCTNDS